MKSALLIALGKASKAPAAEKRNDLADLIDEFSNAPSSKEKARAFRAMVTAASAEHDTDDED